jgi:Domain of unknown function (DUF4349)
LRVPAAQLDKVIGELRGLGQVVDESQAVDDVTEQLTDFEARIANGRNTEMRMKELLRTRTGKLSEVIEAEREVSRVREEIERLDAQRKNMSGRVLYATVTLIIEEEHESSLNLGPLPLSKRLRNAFVDGVRATFESVVSVGLFALNVGPFAIFWLFAIGLPIWFVWRRRARALG